MSIRLTDTVTLHPLELPPAGAGPTAAVRAFAAVRNTSILETVGRDDDVLSAEELLPTLYTTRAAERHHWYLQEHDEMIGVVPVNVLRDDDGRSAIVMLAVLRSHWGRGIGTAASAAIERELRARGVEHLLCWIEHHDDDSSDGIVASPTGFGAVPRDRAARFLERSGFALAQVERVSALTWDASVVALLQQTLTDAQEHAHQYRLVQWMLPTPAEFVDGYAWMKSRMSTDAPDADLDLPEEIWDEDRVRESEARTVSKGFTIQVTAAQHIATGELCAFNELAIRASDPAGLTHQYDTLVLADHRGHRLGRLIKAAGLLSWHERFPDSTRVQTYNAEENRPMLDINEAVGFTTIAAEGAWKKDIR